MRRNNKSRNRGGNSPTRNAQESVQSMNSAVGITTPDHDLNVMGVGNVNRAFQFSDPTNGPSCSLYVVKAYASIWEGFSATSSDPSNGDPGAATDLASPVTDPLYGVTPMAVDMQLDVWPVMETLFSSGTGARYSVTEPEWIRYNALIMAAYYELCLPVMLNYLTYHFDWKQVFPFTDSVPLFLYDLADTYDATDVGLAGRWLPLMKRFEDKVMYPRIMREIRRTMSPMLSVDFNARLQIPVPYNPFTNDADTLFNSVKARIDHIDANLKKASALFSSFLPFPLRDQGIWDFSDAMLDIDRDAGLFNSGSKFFDTFQDTGTTPRS